MKVWGICASISVTVAFIWTKFYIELKHRTSDMKECSKLYDLKIKEGGGRRLGFRKMSVTSNWIESYLRKIWWADTSRPCVDNTWPKLETGTFLRDVIVVMNKDVYYTNVGNIIDALMSIRALNFQICSLSLCRTHLFALLSRLLICHTSLTNKL